MDDSTRRGFLAAAGVGAAAAGVAVVAPGAAAAPPATVRKPAHAKGELVAHVADLDADTVTLMIGDREVVVQDADLVARLARAAF